MPLTDPIDTHGHDVADMIAQYPGFGDSVTGAAITLAMSLAADDIIDTTVAHGLAAGQRIRFATLTGGAGLVVGQEYWVSATSLAATTFRVTDKAGGAAIGFTSDITAGTVEPYTEVALAQPTAQVQAQINNVPGG